MKNIRFILCAVVLACLSLNLQAQEISPVDFMKLNPYRVYHNVATPLPYSVYFGFGIGNLSAYATNSGLKYDNLFQFENGKPKYIDLKKFANSLKDDNSYDANINTELLGVGFRGRYGFFSISYRVRFQSTMHFSKDIIGLAAFGNAPYVGEDNPANMNMSTDVMGYQELSLGYQIMADENLSVGGRAKLLFGFANLMGKDVNIKVYTNPNDYDLLVCPSVDLRMTVPNPFKIDENGFAYLKERMDASDLFGCPGFGLDLAAQYKFEDAGVTISAAVNDLGFITWRKNSLKIYSAIDEGGQYYHEGNVLFDGLSVDEIQKILSDEAFRDMYLDTLQRYYSFRTQELNSYTTSLHTNMIVQGTYELDEQHRFIAQLQGYCSGLGFRPALTLAYNGTFNDMFDVCASYTMMKGCYANIGIGLGVKLGPVQLYATTNNIIGWFTPLNNKNYNAQLGIAFNFYNNTNRSRGH
ncbi:MAG: hypothetical protein HUK16_04735 [Bacteroidales bacterium]|nr:hypothetical protein [Bacteroidales bacterium]